MTLTTKTTNTNHNLFSSNMATEYSRSHLVFSGALKNLELCKYQSSVPSLAVCTERRALDCARMKQASRALVCKRRDGRHSCCAAVLIKTCSPHNVSTPVPNTTRSLSHNVHACKEAAAAAKKQKKQLPINLKYDTCIVKSTNREEETEKIPFSGRRKTEGRVGYSDIERQKQRQRAPQHLGISRPSLPADRAEEQQSKYYTLLVISGPPL